MSATSAVLLPAPSREDDTRRHLDIAPSRAQRRARPRVYAALVAIGGIGAILLAQLLMSIVLADGAYQISSLQKEQRDLIRQQHATQETLEQVSSTQSLMKNAQRLGMVPSGNPVFLDVADRRARGVAGPATGQVVGSGKNLIHNMLLADGSTLLDPDVIAAAQEAESHSSIVTTTSGGKSSGKSGGKSTDGKSGVAPVTTNTGTLPSPTTR